MSIPDEFTLEQFWILLVDVLLIVGLFIFIFKASAIAQKKLKKRFAHLSTCAKIAHDNEAKRSSKDDTATVPEIRRLPHG